MFVENGKTHWLTSKCVENLDIHGERHPLWCKGWPAWPAEEDEDDDRYLGPVDVTQKPIQDPSLLEGVTMHDGYIPKAVLDKFQAELDAKKAAARAARKAAASPK